MNKRFWIILFALSLCLHIIGIVYTNKELQFVSKPFIVIALLGYFITCLMGNKSSFKKWIVLALLFSWVGDVLLMFQENDKLFFLLGLSSFLLAHICYIFYFAKVKQDGRIRSSIFIFFIAGLYGLAILWFLSPYLGEMKWPVRIYGTIISVMFAMALHIVFLKNKKIAYLIIVGTSLFVISDSVLAFNKFYQSFVSADLIIMLTYGLAQLFITKGAIQYIRR
jgi:uncharacterized membrane protein YhhN